jgi:hypothetical protein
MFFKEPDFLAKLNYRTTEEGGRQTPAFSGYRPQVKFPFSEMQTSGQQKFIDKDIVYPGETVNAEIGIISVEFFQHQLSEGMPFEFREGSRVIGTGRILKILNPQLINPNNEKQMEIMKFACPCCGFKTFSHEPNGSYEICKVCYWEDDAIQLEDPDYVGGANPMSLRQAQSNFQRFGACEEAMLPNVRKPAPNEARDENWKPLLSA